MDRTAVKGAPNARGLAPLRLSILAGIVYDWVLAALILASPPALLALFGLPEPPDPFHFRFAAIPLLALPFFYRLAWRDPVRHAGIVGAMVIARLVGFAYLVLYGNACGAPGAFALFGAIDLAFAAAHAALARRAGLGRAALFPR